MSTRSTVGILAGGLGTRLRGRSGNLPKPMMKVIGKPILQYQIELCRKHGFTNILLLVHHRHEVITDYFGDGSALGVQLSYSIENEPRGTAGALRDALPALADRFLLLYGDTFLDVNLRKLWNAHVVSGADGTLFLHPNDHPQDSDLVVTDTDGTVLDILPHPRPEGLEVRNLVNAALYVLERAKLESAIPEEGNADIASHMFPRMLELGCRLNGYVTPEYIKDMGTPDRLDKVERDFVEGLPERLSDRLLRRAVFLALDSAITLETPDHVRLLPRASEAIRRLNRIGTLSLIITNHAEEAKGDLSFEELRRVHAQVECQLGDSGAYVDGIYIGSHHSNGSLATAMSKPKGEHGRAEPDPLLINKACIELGIARHDSWMVSGTTIELECARRAGLRTVMVRNSHGDPDVKPASRPDYAALDISDAVEWILRGHAEMSQRLAPIAIEASKGHRLVLVGGLARAGKSYAAQVLKELMHTLGLQAHVISLDGWLKPKSERAEGAGVCERYDCARASFVIATAAGSNSRVTLSEPLYNRYSHNIGAQSIEHSVGPNDVLIVEGVPALLFDKFIGHPSVMTVYIEVTSATRNARLRRDYDSRGLSAKDFSLLMLAREADETPLVEQSKAKANWVVSMKRNENLINDSQ